MNKSSRNLPLDAAPDEVLAALLEAQEEYEVACHFGSLIAADRLLEEMQSLWGWFVAQVQAEDPHTSEADIRYFEGIKYV